MKTRFIVKKNKKVEIMKKPQRRVGNMVVIQQSTPYGSREYNATFFKKSKVLNL